MSNIVPFQIGAVKTSVDLASMFGIEAVTSKIERTPAISIAGKQFSTVDKNGESTIIKDKASKLPVQTLGVSIINLTPNRSRTYFVGAFDPANPAAPECYSVDGVFPATDVKTPCSTACAACPKAIKGSKPTETNPNAAACHTNKTLAVVPSNVPDAPIMIVRLPVTSLWEGDAKNAASNAADGWYCFDDYLKFLGKNNVQHPIQVETTMKFDPTVVYPKLLFNASGIVSDEVLKTLAGRSKSEETVKALGLDKIRKVAAEPVAHMQVQMIAEAPAPELKVEAQKTPKAPKASKEVVDENAELSSALGSAWGD